MDVVAVVRREAGQTLVEVMAAAALLLVIAVSTTTVLISSDQAAGSSSGRAGAASLLASEQQRLRSLSAVGSLTDLSSTRTATLPSGGPGSAARTYTISSTVAPARDAGGDVSCTADGSAPEYLHSRTSVSWDGGTPLVGESLIAPSPGSEARSLGTLAVQVNDRDARPVSGATVVAGGRTRTTNALGCVVLSYVPAGAYGVSVSYGSEIGPDGSSPATTSASVVAGTTAQPQAVRLDASADLPVTFSSATSASGIAVPSTIAPPTSLSVKNGDGGFNGTLASGAPKPRVLAWSSAKTAVTGLFPFTSGYAVYAGGCAGNDPATWSVPAGSQSTAVLTSGANPSLAVRMPTVALKVSGPASTRNLSVLLTPDTAQTGMADCTGSVTMPATSSTGVTSLALPYGRYLACVASGTWKASGIAVANVSASGTQSIAVAMTNRSGSQTCP